MTDEVGESYHDVLARNIKANKEIIILSMLSKKPMSGNDLIKELVLETKVFLTQSTVYPILYSLEEAGILQAKYEKGDMRTKNYYITAKGREIAQKKKEFVVKSMSVVNDLVQGKDGEGAL
jgi:DNA-binding PadR family transcriptional regulator